MKHTKTYEGLPNGSGQIVCSCGWKSPAVNDSSAFTLGRKVKTVEQYFEEHLASVNRGQPETTMIEHGAEHAVAPAQSSRPRKAKGGRP